MSSFFKDADSIYTPVFEQYNKAVKNKMLKHFIIDNLREYFKPISPADENIPPINSLNEIFSKYKGKVIYIDFWASWCAPCRSEMPNAALLKNKLSGLGVVFIYIGYNDKESPWLKARQQLEIQGEHYLLNDKMIKEADALFGINGIPHYAIIDKDGRIVNKRADRPSEVCTELLKLLKK